MHRTPLDIRRRRLTVNRVAKHVKHPRENGLADWCFQRPARIRDHHAARESLRGRQRNPAHMPRVALRQHFDDNLLFRASVQHRINRRQLPVEPHVHNAAAHRSDCAEICCAGLIVHDCLEMMVEQRLLDANERFVVSP